MSMLQFINSPFPDNHDGFDYSPKSFTDVQNEMKAQVADAQNAEAQKKMMTMLANVMN